MGWGMEEEEEEQGWQEEQRELVACRLSCEATVMNKELFGRMRKTGYSDVYTQRCSDQIQQRRQLKV